MKESNDRAESAMPSSPESVFVAKFYRVSPETFERFAACFTALTKRPYIDMLSRPDCDGEQVAIKYCGVYVIEDHSRNRSQDDLLPNVICDLMKRNEQSDSLPNTPPRTIVDIPHAVKCNGRFYKRYHPENCLVPGKSYDAVKYRDTLFVLSDVAIDDAVDLDLVQTSIVQACKIPNTPRP